MSSPSVAGTSRDAKGKGRATETTPLLEPADDGLVIGGSSARYHAVSPPLLSPSPRQRRAHLRSILVRVFLGTLTICIVSVILIALLIWSYARRAEGADSDRAVRAITWRGPDNVEVLNVGGDRNHRGDRTLSLRVSGKVGVDADVIMGWDGDNDDETSIWESMWKDIGRWGVTILKEVTVSFGEATVYPQRRGSGHLFKTQAEPVTIPLTADPPHHEDWLTPVSFNVTIQLASDSGLLEWFAKTCWETGAINVRVEIDKVHVQGGKTGWRRLVRANRHALESYVHMRIPSVPGIPEPRPPIDQLLNIVSYSLVPTADHNLSIVALATFPNPLPDSHFSIPSLPFLVSLLAPSLSPLPIATGQVAPRLDSTNITLPIEGSILRIPSTSTSPHATIVLSYFLSSFLSGISPPVSVSTPLIPDLHINTLFPAPVPPPKVLRDVTIKKMLLSFGRDGEIFANGQVWARLVMPRGIHVPINATEVWPDVLVYDGEVPKEENHHHQQPTVSLPTEMSLPTSIPIHLPTWRPKPLPHPKVPGAHPPALPIGFPWNRKDPNHDEGEEKKGGKSGHNEEGGDRREPPPLPEPLPERAFARIRPEDWLAAHTTSETDGRQGMEVVGRWVLVNTGDGEGGEDGWSAIVTADIHDVPLQVLPGREALLRGFVSKVLLSKDGALAGVKGTSAVRAAVSGLLAGVPDKEKEEPRLELSALPFEGSVRIGKKAI